MNEERTGKCLRQVEHIRGHLWHRHSIAVNQVMVATVKPSKCWFEHNFQSFDFERTRWRLFQKQVVRTNFDIYVFIDKVEKFPKNNW